MKLVTKADDTVQAKAKVEGKVQTVVQVGDNIQASKVVRVSMWAVVNARECM